MGSWIQGELLGHSTQGCSLRVSPGSSRVVRGQGLGRLQRGCPFTAQLPFHSSKSLRHCACWVLHPLNDLELSDKVDVVVGGGNVGHPLVEDLGESLVGDQPGGVEGEREGGTVGAVVTLKVLVQQLPELVFVVDVAAGGDEVATGEVFIKVGVVTSVKLVDRHLPDRVASAWAVPRVAVALVGHPVLQGVRPDGDPAERGSDGGVVGKVLVGHHVELLVASNPQEGSTNSNNCTIADICKPLNNEPASSHFCQP